MTAVSQLMQLPSFFLDLLKEAAPQALTQEFHSLDYSGRHLDLMEMYSWVGKNRFLVRESFLSACYLCFCHGHDGKYCMHLDLKL